MSPGRWSIGFLVVFLASIAAFFGAVSAGQRGGDRFLDNLWLSAPVLGAWLSAVAAAISGFFAVLARRERAVLAFVSVLVGLLVSAFGAAEVLLPH